MSEFSDTVTVRRSVEAVQLWRYHTAGVGHRIYPCGDEGPGGGQEGGIPESRVCRCNPPGSITDSYGL
jgi:hypothetical protein